jgi:hypothetical protein
MAYSYQQILEAQYQRIADEQAQQVAELEAGRVSEDAFRTTSAADRILELDKSRDALDRRAAGFAAGQQQQPQASRYGLSKDEVDVAHSIASGDRDMTNDDREKSYAEQKQKLRHMRSTGQYSDGQGAVRR